MICSQMDGEDEDKIPNIFGTKKGTSAMTEGIWINMEPYIRSLPDGQPVAVFVVDCQGVDEITPAANNELIDAQIMMLGSLISSHLIYNMWKQYQNHNKKLLEGILAATDSLQNKSGAESKPLQQITIMIRDWPQDSFGKIAGNEYMNNEVNLKSPKEMNILDKIYTKRSCVVLPEPDKFVRIFRRQEEFPEDIQQVAWSNYGKEFSHYAKEFIKDLLRADYEDLKRVQGVDGTIKAEAFGEMLLQWHEAIKSGDYQAINSGYVFSVHTHNEALAKKCLDNFNTEVKHLIVEKLSNFSTTDAGEIVQEIGKKSKELAQNQLKLFRADCKENGLGFNGNHGTHLENSYLKAMDKSTKIIIEFGGVVEEYIHQMKKYIRDSETDLSYQFITGAANDTHAGFLTKGIDHLHRTCKELNYETDLVDAAFREYADKCFQPLQVKANVVTQSIAEYRREMQAELDRKWWFQKLTRFTYNTVDNHVYEKINAKFEAPLKKISFLEKEINYQGHYEFKRETEQDFMRLSETTRTFEKSAEVGSVITGLVASLVFPPAALVVGTIGILGPVVYEGIGYFSFQRNKKI